MQELYSEKDLQLLSAQLKKRYTLLGLALAAVLAVIVWSSFIRLEWLTVLSVILFFATAVFVVDLFCLPIHRYKKLIVSALSGRTHTETLEFERVEAETSVVDGIPCRSLLFLGAPDKHGTREQCYYWDDELPLPPFTEGEQITLKYTGRNIIGYALSR